MRRIGNLLPEVAEMANLRLAFWKAARGKSGRAEVVEYRARLEGNLCALREGLLCGRARVGDYHFFKVYDPKERQICAAAFGERVLHHALVNVCEPYFEKRLVFDTYACREGKGRLKALERAQGFARAHRWYLKLDVRKYFDSIDHGVLRALLGRMFKDAAVLELFGRIIESYKTTPGRGLPIGNLTSQHLANLYLGELDLFVKGTLRVRGYARYMDDFVLWGADRLELGALRGRVEEFVRERLRLELKPEQLNRVERGMPFLGCQLYPEKLRLDRRGRRRFVAKVRYLEWRHGAGRLSARGLQQRATALAAYTETVGARAFRRAVLAQRDFGAAAMDESPGSNRVLRGGSWNNNANNCRAANRNNNNPDNANNNNGFRCVRSSETASGWRNDSDPVAVPSRAPLARAKRGNSSGASRPGADAFTAESSGRDFFEKKRCN